MSNNLFSVFNIPESGNYFLTKKLENYFPNESNRDKYVDGEGRLQNPNSNNDLSDLYSKLHNDNRNTVYFNKSLEVDGTNKKYSDFLNFNSSYKNVFNFSLIRSPKTIFYLSIRRDYYNQLEGDATPDDFETYINDYMDNDKYLKNNLLTFFTNTGNNTKADKYNNIFVDGNFDNENFVFIKGNSGTLDQVNGSIDFLLNHYGGLDKNNILNITSNPNSLLKKNQLSSDTNNTIDEAFNPNGDGNYKYDQKVYEDVINRSWKPALTSSILAHSSLIKKHSLKN
jgi:hypothetical protein